MSQGVPVTVRSKLNNFEHVGGGGAGAGAVYRAWVGLGPCTEGERDKG